MEKKTGIEVSLRDKVQPFRVWYNGNIIWFARTREEAEEKLEKAQKRR